MLGQLSLAPGNAFEKSQAWCGANTFWSNGNIVSSVWAPPCVKLRCAHERVIRSCMCMPPTDLRLDIALGYSPSGALPLEYCNASDVRPAIQLPPDPCENWQRETAVPG